MKPSIYKKNSTEKLDAELFKNPSSEYRGVPFWAWNNRLDKQALGEQIDVFKEMGLGGAHMHVRTGLFTEYLSDEFMDYIKFCTDKFKKEGMLSWLYDEDRWPSGAAGGLVTRDPQYRARHLLFTVKPYQKDAVIESNENSRSKGNRSENGKLIACFDIILDDEGYLKSYKKIGLKAKAKGVKWYAYLETATESGWFNNQTYVNTLDKKAIDKFIEITYETYKKHVGQEFGKTIPAIFTDEPQFTEKHTLKFAKEQSDVILPWTDDLPETFRQAYGDDLVSAIPELIWELPDGKVSKARYDYHDHVAERFANAFADNCGKWCDKNGIMLTGHMMQEHSLAAQTGSLGEAMRSYRSFGLPGIDMLCNRYEYCTAKQAQSASHQYGCQGVLSELYGVTNWDFDFRGHKAQGDWQAALGVTTRVQHLSFFSMEGEAKRDYPASISYQSPWYQKYSYVEDHFARVNTALTRGKPDVKVGVIHPVESYWLHFGPSDQTLLKRNERDKKFFDIIEWLLFGTVDFDFISESLFPSQCKTPGVPLKVGEMKYDVIIVPDCETLRSTTLERLEKFSELGGKLIFMGEAPKYTDAVKSTRGAKLYKKSIHIPYACTSVLSQLKDVRDIEINNSDGSPTRNLIYQMRKDKTCKWLFIAQGRSRTTSEPFPLSDKQDIKITIKGKFTPILYNTLNGDISEIPYQIEQNNTVIHTTLYQNDSLLLCLEKYSGKTVVEKQEIKTTSKALTTPVTVPYTLSEENVLLLDMAEFSIDKGEYRPNEEIIRIDSFARWKLGLSPRGYGAQPWVMPEEPITHFVDLRFSFDSEIAVRGAYLAVEQADMVKIELNGKSVEVKTEGYFTDKAIRKIPLPEIPVGENTLIVTCPIGNRTSIEWCYLLGHFAVKLLGTKKTLTALPKEVSFDDITYQGFPFYGANITYHVEVNSEQDGDILIHIPTYKGSVISVAADGKECGNIAYAPYNLILKDQRAGTHKIDLTLYGNRHNSFGCVHMNDEKLNWFGPNCYRTKDDAWCYEYRLKKNGILCSPVISLLR